MSDDDRAREYLEDDLFAFVPDGVARHIASVCGRLGVGRCTCAEIANIYRAAHGHPLAELHVHEKGWPGP